MKIKPKIAIVIIFFFFSLGRSPAILIETIYNALKSMQDSELQEIDITQVSIAKAKKTSSGTMMISRNPVIIFSGTK